MVAVLRKKNAGCVLFITVVFLPSLKANSEFMATSQTFNNSGCSIDGPPDYPFEAVITPTVPPFYYVRHI